MMCDECNRSEATCSVRVIAGDTTQVRHLCSTCMAKLDRGLSGGQIEGLLANILSAFSERPGETRNEEDAHDAGLMCANCGMTYLQYKKSGRLGCTQCYTAFRTELEPVLQQIHGSTHHTGRRVLTSEHAQKMRMRQEELTREMNRAVAEEDFEQAAVLRDMIRALAEEENVCRTPEM